MRPEPVGGYDAGPVPLVPQRERERPFDPVELGAAAARDEPGDGGCRRAGVVGRLDAGDPVDPAGERARDPARVCGVAREGRVQATREARRRRLAARELLGAQLENVRLPYGVCTGNVWSV
jgi:hypothetical protein